MIRVDGILFDLDGTLADTAADLTAALNRVLADLDRPPLPLARTRPLVSRGAAALLQLALEDQAGEHPGMAVLRDRFLAYYAAALAEHSRLFPGMDGLLAHLQERRIAVGVVTNKPRAYTVPLLDALGVSPAVLLCGDDLPVKKPHPLPVRRACQVLATRPGRVAMVGDDRRDILSGWRAGAATVAAAWGYLGPGEDPARWGADRVLSSAAELVALVDP